METEAIFEQNRKLAITFVSRHFLGHVNARIDVEDLEQVALIALWKACGKWDPAQANLSSLAYRYMHNACMTFVNAAGRDGKLSWRMFRALSEVKNTSRTIEQREGKKPSMQRLQTELPHISEGFWLTIWQGDSLTPAESIEVILTEREPEATCRPSLNRRDPQKYTALTVDDADLDHIATADEAEWFLSHLDPDEAIVIRRLVMDEDRKQDVAREMGWRVSDVERLYDLALDKLRFRAHCLRVQEKRPLSEAGRGVFQFSDLCGYRSEHQERQSRNTVKSGLQKLWTDDIGSVAA